MRKTFIEVSRVGSFLKASKKRGGGKKKLQYMIYLSNFLGLIPQQKLLKLFLPPPPP